MNVSRFLFMMQVVMSIVLLLLFLFVIIPMVRDAMEPDAPFFRLHGPDPVVLSSTPFRPPVNWMGWFLPETPEQIRLREEQIAAKRRKNQAAQALAAQRNANALYRAAFEHRLKYLFNAIVPLVLFFLAYQMVNTLVNTQSRIANLFLIFWLFVVFVAMRGMLHRKYGQLWVDGLILFVVLVVVGRTLYTWWFAQPPRKNLVQEEPCERNEPASVRHAEKIVYNKYKQDTQIRRVWSEDENAYSYYFTWRDWYAFDDLAELVFWVEREKKTEINLEGLTVCRPK